MTKSKNKHNPTRAIALLLLGLLGLGLTLALLLTGTNLALLNPKGWVAQEERDLMVFSILLLLSIAVPTVMILYSFAWKYRETNDNAEYDPDTRHGKLFSFSLWAIPSVFMLALAVVMMPATHKLEPKKTIAAETKPLTIQVVAMRWKWLFIYPEQNIATVNYIQIPTDRPVQFDLTADEAPMSSFWIPQLSGQLYAMTGHVNRLNLVAEEPGDYQGSSAEINGRGFAGMKFTTRATSDDSFDRWVQEVKASSRQLDDDEYAKLLNPSENNPVAYYASFDPTLYDKMLMKYMGSHGHQTSNQEAGH